MLIRILDGYGTILKSFFTVKISDDKIITRELSMQLR